MPLTDPATDSVGQRCCVMKVDGDNAGGSIHFAYRTSGAYGTSAGSTIRGEGNVITLANAPGRLYNLTTGLDPSTAYYWGATLDDPDTASVEGSFTTADLPPAQTGGVKLPGVW